MRQKKSTSPRSPLKCWIEAMRLRTLPVSVAGVFAGVGCAALRDGFCWLPPLICLLFAVLAQIASNFANEYYDYANGLDRKGREGFRRGVTEGDISPQAMKRATFGLIAFDCLLGCTLLWWGGLWLVIPGIAIAIFAVAYSTGPYPLSHHGLGDVAVIIFFGIVPVTLTAYVQTGSWNWIPTLWPMSVSIGVMAANVLIVNNYRDMDDDRAVGKHTTVVLFGRRVMACVYLVGGLGAIALCLFYMLEEIGWLFWVPAAIYLTVHLICTGRLVSARGARLNPLLGITAMNLLLFALLFMALCFAA